MFSLAFSNANIVGYTTSTTTNDGFRTWGACFVNVGGSLTKMSDIKVTGYTIDKQEEEDFKGIVQLQCLDKSGRVVTLPGDSLKVYSWVDAVDDYDDDDKPVYFTGWKLAGADASEETVNPGDGFWVYSDSDQWQIQVAGQVPTFPEGLTVTLNDDGFKMVSNPSAVPLKLKTITVGGYTIDKQEEEDFKGVVQLQCLDKSGRVVTLPGGGLKVYSWIDAVDDYDDDDKPVYFTGWKLDGADAGEDVMNPSESFWTYSDSAQWSFIFPQIVL